MPGVRTILSWAVACAAETSTVSLALMALCSPRWHRPARTIQMRGVGHEGAGYRRWQSTSTARLSLSGLALGTQILLQSFRTLDDSAHLPLDSWVRVVRRS